MMGRALPRLDLPVIKGMNGLLLLTGRGPFEEGYGPCIQCGRCLDACPLGLEPDQVSIRVEAGRTLETEPLRRARLLRVRLLHLRLPVGAAAPPVHADREVVAAPRARGERMSEP